MTISAADFFILVPGPWDAQGATSEQAVDTVRLQTLIERPEVGRSDLDVAVALMDLVRDDLQLSGTGGGEKISDADLRIATRALERSSERAFAFKLPFRDHAGWKSYWIRRGASGTGGWQARRDLLSELFDEPYAKMVAAQDCALDATLVAAVPTRATWLGGSRHGDRRAPEALPIRNVPAGLPCRGERLRPRP